MEIAPAPAVTAGVERGGRPGDGAGPGAGPNGASPVSPRHPGCFALPWSGLAGAANLGRETSEGHGAPANSYPESIVFCLRRWYSKKKSAPGPPSPGRYGLPREGGSSRSSRTADAVPWLAGRHCPQRKATEIDSVDHGPTERIGCQVGANPTRGDQQGNSGLRRHHYQYESPRHHSTSVYRPEFVPHARQKRERSRLDLL